MLKDVLYHVADQIRDFLFFEFVDVFENKKEIWFNYHGKTFILTIRELE